MKCARKGEGRRPKNCPPDEPSFTENPPSTNFSFYLQVEPDCDAATGRYLLGMGDKEAELLPSSPQVLDDPTPRLSGERNGTLKPRRGVL